MNAHFFSNQTEFRAWLEENHASSRELLVGYYKVSTKKASLTWSESVNQALCFGWIDGIRRSIDKESYCIRFTPRKANSIWSAVNIKKIDELTLAGLMKPEGLQAFSIRKESKSNIYSHENATASLNAAFEKQFQENKKAWAFFTAQAPSYKKVILHWITSAKQEKTRLTRLEKTICASEKQLRIQ